VRVACKKVGGGDSGLRASGVWGDGEAFLGCFVVGVGGFCALRPASELRRGHKREMVRNAQGKRQKSFYHQSLSQPEGPFDSHGGLVLTARGGGLCFSHKAGGVVRKSKTRRTLA